MKDKYLEQLFDQYNLTNSDRKILYEYIYDIYIHPEFQRRLTSEFMHHDSTTLGSHILEDAIVTYLLSKKCVKYSNFNQKTAVVISMFHDLYELPWQNNPSAATIKFKNRHGFRHSIEAVINAINWYPDYFKDEEAFKIIDGIVHHMFPFPVNYFYGIDNNPLELKNMENAKKLDSHYINLIVSSTKRKKIGPFSFSRSLFKEGRLMSKADKKVSLGNFKGSKLGAKTSLLSGKNKHIRYK